MDCSAPGNRLDDMLLKKNYWRADAKSVDLPVQARGTRARPARASRGRVRGGLRGRGVRFVRVFGRRAVLPRGRRHDVRKVQPRARLGSCTPSARRSGSGCSWRGQRGELLRRPLDGLGARDAHVPRDLAVADQDPVDALPDHHVHRGHAHDALPAALLRTCSTRSRGSSSTSCTCPSRASPNSTSRAEALLRDAHADRARPALRLTYFARAHFTSGEEGRRKVFAVHVKLGRCSSRGARTRRRRRPSSRCCGRATSLSARRTPRRCATSAPIRASGCGTA